MTTTERKDDDIRWLALLVRQGLKIIVIGIERRYGLRAETQAEALEVHKRRADDRRMWP